MPCARCGEIFEGRFCPRCGAPAPMTSPPSAAPQGQVGWPCPRCGTLFAGNFCPRCGLPRGAWAPRPAPASSARPILTILWTLAIAGFVLFAITDFAGLAVSPSLVVPNIQGMRSDQTVNSGMDFNGNWTFDQWGTASSPSYQASGGNPDGFIEMTLFGTGDRGYFWQAFNVSGSRPYTGVLRGPREPSPRAGSSSRWTARPSSIQRRPLRSSPTQAPPVGRRPDESPSIQRSWPRVSIT